MSRQPHVDREFVRAEVSRVALDLAGRGTRPTAADLSEHVPGASQEMIGLALREVLAAHPWIGDLPRGSHAGLNGSTPASRKVINDRHLEIQAQKEARGEPYAVPNPPADVVRSRDYRFQEHRR